MSIPKRISDRMRSGLKRLIPIIQQQRSRDVSEADTVTLVKDVLSEVLGYDKYAELTGEHAIRGTYCDLAVKLDEKITQLIEVKAVGVTLSDRHLRQAVDYAANQGIEWVILTNAVVWQLHHVIFSKPIDKKLVLEIDLTSIDPKHADDLELIYPLTKEGFIKGLPGAIRDRQAATSRFLLGALLLGNETVLNLIRRELRRVVDVNVSAEEIADVLRKDVLKRDVLEGPEADEASKRIKRAETKSLRSESSTRESDDENAADKAGRPADDSAHVAKTSGKIT